MTSSTKKSAITASIYILLCAGAFAIIAAMWLRFSHAAARNAVTLALGSDGRAILEHLLAAIGLPLFLHMLLVAPVKTPANWAFGQREQYRRLPNILMEVSHMLDRYCGAIISATYFACALHWEHYQAYVSVYGQAPRGYVQGGQLLADAAGAVLAVVIAKAVRLRPRGQE